MLTLDQNEKLITVFRKHPFYFFVQMFSLAMMALLPLFIVPFLGKLVFSNAPELSYLVWFLYFIFLGGIWFIIFLNWTDYYLDMWILTDKRLIDVEQKGLFSREISSMRLDRIQDVKIEVSGIIDTMLHIGSIHVQTAGSEKEFIIPHAKNPPAVKELILGAHNKQVEAVQTVRVENNNSLS